MPTKNSRKTVDRAGRLAIREIKAHYQRMHPLTNYKYLDADMFCESSEDWECYALDYDTEFNIKLELRHTGVNFYDVAGWYRLHPYDIKFLRTTLGMYPQGQTNQLWEAVTYRGFISAWNINKI